MSESSETVAPTDDIIEWSDPPAPKPSRADRVAGELRARPGSWALIAQTEGLELMPWWGPLYRNPEYEVEFRPIHPDRMFGPRDIYARFRTAPS